MVSPARNVRDIAVDIGERALKIHQNERHKIKSEETDAVDGTVR